MPNPQLEAELGSMLRGDFSLDIQSPTAQQTIYVRNGEISLTLTALLETQLLPGDDFSLFIEIYSNVPVDFRNSNYVINHPLTVYNNSTPYSIQESVTLTTQPGLYYYLIRDDFSGATLGGGRLRVE